MLDGVECKGNDKGGCSVGARKGKHIRRETDEFAIFFYNSLPFKLVILLYWAIVPIDPRRR